MSKQSRREVLAGGAAALISATSLAHAASIKGELPFQPDSESLPEPVQPGSWHFFSAEEGRAVEAIVDRLIPPDPETPGGKEAGCAVFIDRQLAGPYGSYAGQYRAGPYHQGIPEQGDQSPLTPVQHYRSSLAALDRSCRSGYDGKSFADLTDAQKDDVLKRLEEGSLALDNGEGKSFFALILTNTQQGFFADPIYGGNKDMVAWKMIGFPGARYDYRDWVERHNQPYPEPPIGIAAHPAWKI